MKPLPQASSNSFVEGIPLTTLEYLKLPISSIAQESPERQRQLIGMTLSLYIHWMYRDRKKGGIPYPIRQIIFREISQFDKNFGDDLVQMFLEYFDELPPREQQQLLERHGSGLEKIKTKTRQKNRNILPRR